MNEFEKTIKEYLDKKAETDPAFSEKYANPDKSIKACCKYIICQVQKTKRQGFADAEIFGMAIHYYDEDTVKVPASVPSCHVVVNHEVSLSEEDKKKLKAEAQKDFKLQEMEKIRKAAEVRKQRERARAKAKAAEMAEKRRQQEERDRNDGILLFNFEEAV